jgi:hypothetical protein
MGTIIRELAETTQVRDRQGQVVTTFKGTLFTLILRVFLMGLSLLFVVGFVTLIYNLMANGLDNDVAFGIYN